MRLATVVAARELAILFAPPQQGQRVGASNETIG
jgi:hypothetical protein